MTMKQFRDATENVPDDALLVIDFGNGQFEVEGEQDVFVISVRTVDQGEMTLSVVVG